MCGRFTLTSPAKKLVEFFDLGQPDVDLVPRYNIAPTQNSVCVREIGGTRELISMRWGLLPAWSKHESEGARLINARSETVDTMAAFRDAFRSRRCIVPANGFFEWKKSGSHKQPYLIRRWSNEPLAFAGLWESWSPRESDEVIESFTILTTSPNQLVADIHDRMPVILGEDQHAAWLNSDTETTSVQEFLKPCPAEEMEAVPVHRSVGNVKNDSETCIRPIKPVVQKELFG
ncbi:MAG: SOS response-associated peptidase [Planctomycetaceae bacterium]